MDFHWFKEPTKHWMRPDEDWLCFRKSRADNAEVMILFEGSHHYFEEVHVHNAVPDGEPSLHQFTVEGPGPFQIKLFPNTDCLILARARFFRYQHRPPPQPVRCAAVRRSRDAPLEEFRFQVDNSPPTDSTSVPLPSASVLIKRLAKQVGDSVPDVYVSSFGENRTVGLRQEAAHEMLFCFFANKAPAMDLTPGKSVDLESLHKAGLEIVSIPAGKTALQVANWNKQWTVALPVACLSASRGMVGEPLILAPLITDLEVIAAPPKNVMARWKWLGPLKWMRVRLCWDYHDDQGPSDAEAEERVVSYTDYHSCGYVELARYDQMHRLSDWRLELTAVPYILGVEDSGHNPLEAGAQL